MERIGRFYMIFISPFASLFYIFISYFHFVFSFCLFILYLHFVFSFCIFILYLHFVFSFCIFILYFHFVSLFCIFILYFHLVSSFLSVILIGSIAAQLSLTYVICRDLENCSRIFLFFISLFDFYFYSHFFSF